MTDKSPAPEHDFQQKASWEMETLPPPTSQRGGWSLAIMLFLMGGANR